jgi:hypothetical protein
MIIYALDICPNKTSGLCNQLYSIAAGIKYCIINKINIMFINKFLKSINSEKYCNISEIFDLYKFNMFLQKYNLFILDYNNFDFNIEDAFIHDDNNNVQNIKNIIIDSYYQNKSIKIEKGTRFYLKNSKEKNLYLTIKYGFDNGVYTDTYIINDNELSFDIYYDFSLLKFEKNFSYTQDEVFFDILRNIPFCSSIINQSKIKVSKLLNNKITSKINTIHLRIEDDVIKHFSIILNMNKDILKNIIENKFIDIIKTLNKSDLIILLTYSKKNNVIDYLKNNGYNFVIDEDKHEDREISAIYDLLLGENCNNYYICVWESSYSYTLLSRINKKENVKSIQIYYEHLNKEPVSFKLLF